MEMKHANSTRNLQHDCLSAKSKSSLSTARSTISQNQEKISKPKSTLDRQLSRNFRFSMSPNEKQKKEYKKNSDKMIKPPEKYGKQTVLSIGNDGSRSLVSDSTGKLTEMQRGGSQISARRHSAAISARSLTQNLDEKVLRTYAGVDKHTMSELEERLESLQSIFIRKLELLKSREPEELKKEYKFIALVTDDESKLVIKSSDAKRFPEFLPSKSVEDFNRKAEEFFVACILAFVDKLRHYQESGRPIKCHEIYEELKGEGKDYCCILQNWISDMYTNANSTEDQIDCPKVEVHCQTDICSRNKLATQEVQTDAVKDEPSEKTAVTLLTIKMDRLRLENYELRDQLKEKDESFKKKMKILEETSKQKYNELSDFLEQERSERTKTEKAIKSEQKLSEDLSLQVMDLKDELCELKRMYEESLYRQEEAINSNIDLKKYRNQIEQLQAENSNLQEQKANLVKKLDKRYAQYELMEKEIKLQKRIVRAKVEEIDQIKNQFETKIKEHRQLKDSFEARNKLIDHLRNAIDIDQKTIRELELKVDCKRKLSENYEPEIKQRFSQDEKQKRFRTSESAKSRDSIGVLFRKSDQNQFIYSEISSGLSPSNMEQKIRASPKPKERRKKSNLQSHDVIEPLIETKLTNISIQSEKTPTRNVKPLKRSRDIVVKKYEV